MTSCVPMSGSIFIVTCLLWDIQCHYTFFPSGNRLFQNVVILFFFFTFLLSVFKKKKNAMILLPFYVKCRWFCNPGWSPQQSLKKTTLKSASSSLVSTQCFRPTHPQVVRCLHVGVTKALQSQQIRNDNLSHNLGNHLFHISHLIHPLYILLILSDTSLTHVFLSISAILDNILSK